MYLDSKISLISVRSLKYFPLLFSSHNCGTVLLMTLSNVNWDEQGGLEGFNY